MAGDPRQCSGGFFNMGRHSGFRCWGRGATIQVWKWERFDCLSGGRMKWGQVERGAGEREERGRLALTRFICTKFCSTLFLICVLLPLQNVSAWRFISFLKSGVKWCGTRQRGEVEQIGKRAERFILCPASSSGARDGWMDVHPILVHLAAFLLQR